jgi:hypothetical protein
MKLAAFIASNMDEIVAEFVTFARTLQPAAAAGSAAELHDHGRAILATIATDMESAQTAKQTRERSIVSANFAAPCQRPMLAVTP